MKKNKIIAGIFITIGSILVLAFTLFIVILLLPKHEISNNEISDIISLNVNKLPKKIYYTDYNEYNSLGIGKYICSFKYKKGQDFSTKKGWKELPLSEEVESKILRYDLSKGEHYKDILPKINNGYYIYYNKSVDSPYDEKYNICGDYLCCCIAIYDSESGVIYFVDSNYE